MWVGRKKNGPYKEPKPNQHEKRGDLKKKNLPELPKIAHLQAKKKGLTREKRVDIRTAEKTPEKTPCRNLNTLKQKARTARGGPRQPIGRDIGKKRTLSEKQECRGKTET